MNGKTMWMVRGDTKVTLGQLVPEHAPVLAENLQYLESSLYTMMPDRSPSLGKEEEWIKRVLEDETERIWAVFVNDKPEPIGTFAFGSINNPPGEAIAGAMIFDTDYQSMGLGSMFIAPMVVFYAFDLMSIPIYALRADIIAQNPRSWHLAKAMGSTLEGTKGHMYLRFDPETRQSRYCDLRSYVCFNPKCTRIKYPQGMPRRYRAGVMKTREVLEEARRLVQFKKTK